MHNMQQRVPECVVSTLHEVKKDQAGASTGAHHAVHEHSVRGGVQGALDEGGAWFQERAKVCLAAVSDAHLVVLEVSRMELSHSIADCSGGNVSDAIFFEKADVSCGVGVAEEETRKDLVNCGPLAV